jgi:hypothetical protein
LQWRFLFVATLNNNKKRPKKRVIAAKDSRHEKPASRNTKSHGAQWNNLVGTLRGNEVARALLQTIFEQD